MWMCTVDLDGYPNCVLDNKDSPTRCSIVEERRLTDHSINKKEDCPHWKELPDVVSPTPLGVTPDF
jgi:hypothetical protein